MVLYKRKAIDFLSNPEELQLYNSMDSVSLWEIKETGELFLRYEEYLSRRDFYLQRKFTCEITGRQGLNFFDALDSELTTTREIKSSFPKALRRPILKLVHFATHSRLEQLVNWVHETFKQDYFPGEHVICTGTDGERVDGVIREKVTFPGGKRPDGSLMYQPFSKYTVQVRLESPDGPQEDFFETKDVMRDRRNFSKHLIRSFLKNALEREPWHGAPWVVRSILAKECALPLDIPAHLQQSARIAEKKALKKLHLEQQRQAEQSMFTITDFRQHPNGRKGGLIAGPAGPPIMPQPWQSRPGSKQKTKFIHNFQLQSAGNNLGNQTDFRHYPMDPNQPHVPVNGNGLVQGFVVYPHDQPPYAQGAIFQHVTKLPTHQKDKMSLPPSPPPFKFPMEDLDVPPKETSFQRPKLKSFVESSIVSLELDEEYPTGRFNETSIGSLLEVWNTLNVHSEVFILDSFTFDDLAEALRFSAPDVECELLTEVHCAVLKQLVDQKGDLLVDLPRLQVSVEKESEESEEESEVEEEEQPEEESPEPQPEPLRRTTRGSLAKAEALAMAQAESPTPEKVIVHQAAELEADSPWRERCGERDFKNNNWQSVLAGLIYQVSLKDFMKERCEKILSHLLPPDMEPSNETVMDQYATLDVNLRLDALEIIVMLALRTKAIRDHLEKMSQEMTDLRKKKLEQQRLKKDLIDQLQALDVQRKELSAEVETKVAPSEKGKIKEQEEEDMPMPDILEANGEANGRHDSEDGSEDEAPRSLRRGQDRASERKRKREEESARKEKERKEKAAATKLSKQEIKLKKLQEQMRLKKEEIKDCEDQVADLNNDLRETDCQRTKVLGRDRFCNRYYWFERNGMPFGGIPDTSTAHYGYANGRLWVQGPDPMELTGLLELSKEDQVQYKSAYGVTPDERKEKEEGETHLENALHWGYMDDAESIDSLVAWLDERGIRERTLRKELQSWRDVIVECMQKLKAHMEEDEARRAASEVDAAPAMRISTRTKTYVDLDTTKWRCLAWQNTLAMRDLGLKHGDGVMKKRGRKPDKQKIALDKKGKAAKRGR